MLVIATPDAVGVRQMIETARTLNPQVQVVVRTHSDEEAQLAHSAKARAPSSARTNSRRRCCATCSAPCRRRPA